MCEDDQALREELKALLGRWEYDATWCEDFSDVAGACLMENPHLVIMDVNLPMLDGFAWCARIRQVSSVPVLFLSARDTSSDAIRAMEGGGDDYLTKPFAPHLLISKIGALLRRTYEYVPPAQGLLSCGGASLDMANAVLLIGDARLALTKNEQKLLARLMEHKGQLVPRAQLMRLLWDDDVYVNENSLTVNMNRLRRRIAEAGLPDLITTGKGVGYGILF